MSRRKHQVQTAPAEETTRERETTAAETQQTRRVGRPTLCTPELARQMEETLREYGFLGLACDLLGIGRATAYEWIERGEAGEAPFDLFADAVKKGRAAFQAQAARIIAEGKQGWQSRAWLLERSDPEQYAVRQRVEHSGRVETGAAPVLSPAEWEARKRQILGGEDAETVH